MYTLYVFLTCLLPPPPLLANGNQVAELDEHLDKYIRKNGNTNYNSAVDPSNTTIIEESNNALSEDSFTSSKDVRNGASIPNGKPVAPNINSTAEIVELPDDSQPILQRGLTR